MRHRPWALAKLRSERPHTGANASFETTDPRINYCDPIGLPRIYSVPNLVKFVQTPDAVYMLFEYDSVDTPESAAPRGSRSQPWIAMSKFPMKFLQYS